jgi:hypothetical protein
VRRRRRRRQLEVDELDALLAVDEYVLGFDVAVRNVVAVQPLFRFSKISDLCRVIVLLFLIYFFVFLDRNDLSCDLSFCPFMLTIEHNSFPLTTMELRKHELL